MKRQYPLAFASGAILASAILGSAQAETEIRVAASINPLHSLVSAVMSGVGEPYSLMRDAGSHHTFNMRPSDAAALQEADVIFLIDESIETALADAIRRMAHHAEVIELAATPGLVLWPIRDGGAFETDPHHSHEGEEATITEWTPIMTMITGMAPIMITATRTAMSAMMTLPREFRWTFTSGSTRSTRR